MKRTRCERCHTDALTYRWVRFANGTHHIEIGCDICGAHNGWAPQTTEYLDIVGPKPDEPTERQGSLL